MSFWNETCILSKLPIEEDESCVMVTGNNILPYLFDIDSVRCLFRDVSCLQIYFGNYNGRGCLYKLSTMINYNHTIFINRNVWNWLCNVYDILENGNSKLYYEREIRESIIKLDRAVEYQKSSLIKSYDHINNINYGNIYQYMRVSFACGLLKLTPNSLCLKGSNELKLKEFKEWLEFLNILLEDKIFKQNK